MSRRGSGSKRRMQVMRAVAAGLATYTAIGEALGVSAHDIGGVVRRLEQLGWLELGRLAFECTRVVEITDEGRRAIALDSRMSSVLATK